MSRFALVLALAPLAGCPTKDGTACTEIAIASVIVNLSTDDGGAIVDPEVGYSTDGETFTACEELVADEQFVCGYEIAGDITIRATAYGYAELEEVVTVVDGECHVVSETFDAVLTPMPDEG